MKPFSAKKVEFSYDKKKILNDLNLSVKHNQILAIVGRSGEGKSTFLNLIVGTLTKSYQGSIQILGKSKHLRKTEIAYVPQEISLIPDLSIKENFEFFAELNGKKLNLEKAKSLMRILRLDTEMNRSINTLSGGQKVRINIIASILHDPKIIILDEPFVGLDYYNRKVLWHFLEKQKHLKKTVILTTHMLTEAETYSDNIVVLQKGKIVAKGKMDTICKKFNTEFISEIKFSYLSKTKQKDIEDYCKERNIKVMDTFNNYFVFSLPSTTKRHYLIKFIDKLDVSYEEISFRKPNLDELSLRVSHD